MIAARFDPLLLEASLGFCAHEHQGVASRVSDVERDECQGVASP